jgi:hypothetical protein
MAERLCSGVFEHVDQRHLASVERSVGPVGRRLAPADVASADFKEVAVRPAERRLKRQMQPVELDVGGNLDAPQNLGLESLSMTLRRRKAAVMPRDCDAPA